MRPVLGFALLILCAHGSGAQTQWWQKEIVIRPDTSVAFRLIEGIEYKRAGAKSPRLDVYIPQKGTQPRLTVLLVHGGPVPQDLPVDARGMGQYRSLARLLVSANMNVVAVAHRLYSVTAIDTAAADVLDAFRFTFAHASQWQLDTSQVCLWTISAGGVVVGPAVAEFGSRLRCLIAYYTIFTPSVFRSLLRDTSASAAPSVIHLIRAHGFQVPPTLVARAGLDNARINADLDEFIAVAIASGGDVEVHAAPQAHHAFDVVDDTPASRRILLRTIEFLREQRLPP